MEQLPDGVVTFLFTDVEGSTRLWEDAPDQMMEALRIHDAVIGEAVRAHNGVPVKPRGEGDSQFVVFASALDAVAGSADVQRRLAAIDWPTPRPLLVRASLHTGQAELELGDYYGSVVNRAARLRAIAHGGQTILSQATFAVVQDHLPAGVRLTDMGLHRLKDLTRPERVYQLEVEGLASSFPPLASLDAVPNNLPEQLTDLIGRDSELATVKQLIADNRLLTVLAPGGTGKTRLAIQAAADLTAEFPDGVFLVALADISDSGDIVQTVAETVGVALASEDDPRSQLLNYLGSRRQLLVFDNFEHVSDGALIISEILGACPEITVIATSRTKLGLIGEAVMPLVGLATSWATADEALQTAGVELFLDAARRARPGWMLKPDDLEPLSEILRATEGMPLAILLAAAWVDMLSIADIASEIATSLDFLETGAVDAPDRHRSIRAVFDYTWRLLEPEEQRAFAALSVFRGGFTRDAAAAVAGASLRDLANLAAKSLVVSDPESGRFSLHELLRQYSEAELERDTAKSAEVRQSHAGFYARLTETSFALFPIGRQRQMVTSMEDDIDNIRLAWRHYVATRDAVGIRRMIRGLWIFFEVLGWYQASLALVGEAAGAFEDGQDPDSVVAGAYVQAMHGANLVLLGGSSDEGVALGEVAVEHMRRCETPEGLFFSFQMVAQSLLYLGRLDEVTAVADEAIGLGEDPALEWDDRVFWAAGFKNLRAFVAILRGDVATALRLLDESASVLEPLGDLYYMSWNLGHRARLAIGAERLDEALSLFAASADRARELGFLRGLQLSVAALGDVSLTAGRFDDAEAAFIESLDAADRTSLVPAMLGTMVRLAGVYRATGRNRAAVELLAAVVAEPASSQKLLTHPMTVNAMATAELDELREQLDPAEFEEAIVAGSNRPYALVAKELIDSR